MKNCYWIITGIGLLLLSSCQPNRPKQATIQPSPQSFANPIVPAKPQTLPTVKVPVMTPASENKTSLMPVATSSTRDPFSAPTFPTTLKATFQPATSKTASNQNQPVTTPPQPTIADRPQATPSIAQPTPLPTLPITQQSTIPPTPTVSQTNLADAIALTGVIQAGNQLSAIVRDTDGSARYVQVGESLANGQVTLKKINLNSSGNPSIVLMQNGIELIKRVGQS